jgi:hypothetical protein
VSAPGPANSPGRYRREAETFVAIMADLAPHLALDYSAASIERLEAFIAATFDPPVSRDPGPSLPVGVGCYAGEVIRRTLGGHWNREGRPELNALGPIEAIFPLDKARKRFANGPMDSLVAYYSVVAQYARKQE